VLGRDATVFESATDDEPNTTVSPEESQEQADAVETYTRLAPGQTWSGPDDQPGVEQHPDPDPAESVPDPEQEESDAYDPSDHTVDDVLAYATDHPDEVEAIRVAEEQGKARVGILDKL
jgi:xanthine/CO dehydrogenase XdhC/CoxF family maturation factor